jgi:hypothetical protein
MFTFLIAVAIPNPIKNPLKDPKLYNPLIKFKRTEKVHKEGLLREEEKQKQKQKRTNVCMFTSCAPGDPGRLRGGGKVAILSPRMCSYLQCLDKLSQVSYFFS